MKKSLVKGIMKLGQKVFTNVALSTSASACIWDAYQPKEPKSLREK